MRLPELTREQKVNTAFGMLAGAGALTLATGGLALPVVAAGVLVEGGMALLGANVANTVLNWVDRRGGKTSCEPASAKT